MSYARLAYRSLGAIAIPSTLAAYSAMNQNRAPGWNGASFARQPVFAQSDEEDREIYHDHARNIKLFGGSVHPSLTKQLARYLGLPRGRILLSK